MAAEQWRSIQLYYTYKHYIDEFNSGWDDESDEYHRLSATHKKIWKRYFQKLRNRIRTDLSFKPSADCMWRLYEEAHGEYDRNTWFVGKTLLEMPKKYQETFKKLSKYYKDNGDLFAYR